MKDLLGRFENVVIWAMVTCAGFYLAFLAVYLCLNISAILMGIAIILLRVCQRIHPYPLIGLAISASLWVLIVLAKKLTRAPLGEELRDASTVADGSYGLYEKRHDRVAQQSKSKGSNDY